MNETVRHVLLALGAGVAFGIALNQLMRVFCKRWRW